MEKNTTIIIAIVTLVIGLSLGYVLGTNKTSVLSNENQDGKMMHQMPDDTMMRNDNMSMSDMMSSMNAELKGKTGDAFDQAFLAEMIVHHEGAVEMANLALTNAKNQEIKSLSKAIISAQNSEISQMKGWQKSWYNQ
jgi:uncharacterized protein (DUF305 family)